MRTTLTIRAPGSLRDALRRRAEVQGRSISEVAREILQDALTERPLKARVSHLKGRLAAPSETDDPWRRQIAERNWRS